MEVQVAEIVSRKKNQASRTLELQVAEAATMTVITIQETVM